MHPRIGFYAGTLIAGDATDSSGFNIGAIVGEIIPDILSRDTTLKDDLANIINQQLDRIGNDTVQALRFYLTAISTSRNTFREEAIRGLLPSINTANNTARTDSANSAAIVNTAIVNNTNNTDNVAIMLVVCLSIVAIIAIVAIVFHGHFLKLCFSKREESVEVRNNDGNCSVIIDERFTETIEPPEVCSFAKIHTDGPDEIALAEIAPDALSDLQKAVTDPVVAAINDNTAVLKELLPLMAPETEDDTKSSKKPAGLKIPGVKIDYEQVVTQIYESRPETILFTSERLLALLKGLPGGENVTITEARLRHLKVWKKHRAVRESGKEQYWDDMGNVTTDGKLVQKGKNSDDSR